MVSVGDYPNDVKTKKKKGLLDELHETFKKIYGGGVEEQVEAFSPVLKRWKQQNDLQALAVRQAAAQQAQQQAMSDYQKSLQEAERIRTKIMRYQDLKKKHTPRTYANAMNALEVTLLESVQALRQDEEKLTDADRNNLVEIVQLLSQAKELSEKSDYLKLGKSITPEEVTDELKTLKMELVNQPIELPKPPTLKDYMDWKRQMETMGSRQYSNSPWAGGPLTLSTNAYGYSTSGGSGLI